MAFSVSPIMGLKAAIVDATVFPCCTFQISIEQCNEFAHEVFDTRIIIASRFSSDVVQAQLIEVLQVMSNNIVDVSKVLWASRASD